MPPNSCAGRMRSTRSLDEVLTSCGLFPHPRLVLVVEGETEYALMPHALALLLSNRDEDVISIRARDERVGLYSCSGAAVIDDFGCGSRSHHVRPWLDRNDRLEWRWPS